VKVIALPAQIVEPGFPAIAIVGVTTGVTDIVMGMLSTFGLEAHVGLAVISHVITSLSFNVVDVNMEEFVPTLLPFTFHR
jgi:hypothetical protein